jgi:hypothetical protein
MYTPEQRENIINAMREKHPGETDEEIWAHAERLIARISGEVDKELAPSIERFKAKYKKGITSTPPLI